VKVGRTETNILLIIDRRCGCFVGYLAHNKRFCV